MQSFENTFHQFNWNSVQERIYAVGPADVQRSLRKAKKTLEDFLVLLSPAASESLEEMAQLTQQLTQQRFGKTIQLYAPLYLSNECQNICTYCGFSMDNPIKRKTLNAIEIMQEAAALKAMGINHVLLVSGEANKTVGIDYFLKAIKLLRPHFAHISVRYSRGCWRNMRPCTGPERMRYLCIRKLITKRSISAIIRKVKNPTLPFAWKPQIGSRSEEHTSELQSRENLVCRLLLEKKKHNNQ